MHSRYEIKANKLLKIKQQNKYTIQRCLYEEIITSANKKGINMDIVDIGQVTKSSWKRVVKN